MVSDSLQLSPWSELFYLLKSDNCFKTDIIYLPREKIAYLKKISYPIFF